MFYRGFFVFARCTGHRSWQGIARPMDAGSPCDKDAVLGAGIKETPCSINLINFMEICYGCHCYCSITQYVIFV